MERAVGVVLTLTGKLNANLRQGTLPKMIRVHHRRQRNAVGCMRRQTLYYIWHSWWAELRPIWYIQWEFQFWAVRGTVVIARECCSSGESEGRGHGLKEDAPTWQLPIQLALEFLSLVKLEMKLSRWCFTISKYYSSCEIFCPEQIRGSVFIPPADYVAGRGRVHWSLVSPQLHIKVLQFIIKVITIP